MVDGAGGTANAHGKGVDYVDWRMELADVVAIQRLYALYGDAIEDAGPARPAKAISVDLGRAIGGAHDDTLERTAAGWRLAHRVRRAAGEA